MTDKTHEYKLIPSILYTLSQLQHTIKGSKFLLFLDGDNFGGFFIVPLYVQSFLFSLWQILVAAI